MSPIFKFVVLLFLSSFFVSCEQKENKQFTYENVMGCTWISESDLGYLLRYERVGGNISVDVSRLFYEAIEQANCYVNRERYDSAIALLDILVNIDVDFESIRSAYKARGIANFKNKNFEMAISDLTKAVNSNLPDYEIFYFVGESFKNESNYKSAIDAFMLALETLELQSVKTGRLPVNNPSGYIEKVYMGLVELLDEQGRKQELEKVRQRFQKLGIREQE